MFIILSHCPHFCVYISILTPSATADTFYTAERGTTVYNGRPTTWTGKVGLMYPSDYGYASGSVCLSTALLNYSNNCYKINYLCKGQLWLQSPYASTNGCATVVDIDGGVYGEGYIFDYGSSDIFPSLYLKSEVKITGGDGSESNPFTLGL